MAIGETALKNKTLQRTILTEGMNNDQLEGEVSQSQLTFRATSSSCINRMLKIKKMKDKVKNKSERKVLPSSFGFELTRV